MTLVACSPDASNTTDSAATQMLVIATAADADALLPPLVATTAGKQVMDVLFEHLADPKDATLRTDGDAGFVPRLASGWTWATDSLSIAFTLNDKARWHDGQPVTSADVRLSYELYTDPKVGSIHASGFSGIDSVTTPDARTAVVWWHARHPEQFFQVAYNLAIMPAHVLRDVPRDSLRSAPAASNPVGSGPYRFASWERKRQLVLTADSTHYQGTPTFGRVVWTILPDAATAAKAVFAGQAAVIEVLRGEAAAEAARTPSVRLVEYGALDYGYMAFNLGASRRGRVSFADRALRAALSSAVNRDAIVANALDSLGRVALGPFTRTSSVADTTVGAIGYDTTRASQVLDSLGWRLAPGDSVRRRNGQPLRFSILFPTTSGTRRRLAVLLQEQYARIGVGVDVDGVEPPVFAQRLQKGDFDAVLNAWRDDPSPVGIRQAWGTPSKDQMGANFGGYSNRAFDALVDSAATQFNGATRQALMRRAHRLIVEDAPALWLYEPRNIAAVRSDIEPTGVRPDAWLGNVAHWKVSPSR
ncbi:MAG: peptide ABC transporter substrate-binding protein [Gemmatimonadaceae bacterium]|nr:peptide ABC transporter substrate-binding protein [Gemmatimonadaceae bacterium]